MLAIPAPTAGPPDKPSAESDNDDDDESSESENASGSKEDSEEEEDSDSDGIDDRNAEQNEKLLKQMRSSRAPKVPSYPAPPEALVKLDVKIPLHLIREAKGEHLKETTLDQALNSTMGRQATFCLTATLFITAAVLLVMWSSPENVLSNVALRYLGLGILSALALYVLMPMLANKTGMNPINVGWKPYLPAYRCAFLTAIPSLVFLGIYGAAIAFGPLPEGAATTTISSLDPKSLDYFQANDGFVALNLTKGIIETLKPIEHGEPENRRKSRFRNAELRINREPYMNIPEPTIPPDMLLQYRIAPVFRTWSYCLTRYRVSVRCLRAGQLLGWAYMKSESLCTSLGMVACKAPLPTLNPVYRCENSPVYGSTTTSPIYGLCGRVAIPPEEAVIDELRTLYQDDGWPSDIMPNSSSVWIDVRKDECMVTPKDCVDTWNKFGAIGMCLGGLTLMLIMVPACMDIAVDRWIRNAQSFIQTQKAGIL